MSEKKWQIAAGVAILVVLVGVGGLAWKKWGSQAVGGGGTAKEEVSGFRMFLKGCEGIKKGTRGTVEMWADVGEQRVSTVELKIKGKDGAKIVKIAEDGKFFSPVKNAEKDGWREYAAVIVKRYDDLPTGTFLVGKMEIEAGAGREWLEVGKGEMVVATKPGEMPMAKKLVFEGCSKE